MHGRDDRWAMGLALLLGGCAQGVIGDPSHEAPRMEDGSAMLTPDARSTTDVRAADLDGDGDLDLVWASQPGEEGSGIDGAIDLSINSGDGRLEAGDDRIPRDLGAWTFVRPVDVDGDGDLDLALSRPAVTSGQVAVLLNDGGGYFERSATVPELPGEEVGLVFSRLEAADVDADGDPDLLVPVFSDLDFDQDAPNVLLLNDGSGGFERDTDGRLPDIGLYQDYTLSIVARDFTGDGAVDLFLGEAERRPRLLVNDGSGRFVDESTDDRHGGPRMPDLQLRAYDADAADLDGDGDQDLVVVNDVIVGVDESTAPQGNFLLRNDGGGWFEPSALPETTSPQDTRGLAIADFNGDGLLDLVLGNNNLTVDHGGRALEILVADGDGAFAPVMDVPLFEVAIFGVAVGDLDGNGLPDVAAAVAGSAAGDAEPNIVLRSM